MMSISDAQQDMREAYHGGATGALIEYAYGIAIFAVFKPNAT